MTFFIVIIVIAAVVIVLTSLWLLGMGNISRRSLCITLTAILIPIALICIKSAYDVVVYDSILRQCFYNDDNMPQIVINIMDILHIYPGLNDIFKTDALTWWGLGIGVVLLWVWYFLFVHFSNTAIELDKIDAKSWEDTERKNSEMDKTYSIQYNAYSNNVKVKDVTNYKTGTSWVLSGILLVPLSFVMAPIMTTLVIAINLLVRCLKK